MALTDSSRIYNTNVQNIDYILDYCKRYFLGREYQVTTEETVDGGFISLTNGGIFKSISGMNTGLNFSITQMPGALSVAMKVGIFGKQLVPTAISMLVFWPILIPQIYGLVQQNKLDTEAYSVIEAAIRECENTASLKAAENENTVFCPFCGKSMPVGVDFCGYCSKRVTDEPVICSGCGAEVPNSFAFCPKCGAKVAED